MKPDWTYFKAMSDENAIDNESRNHFSIQSENDINLDIDVWYDPTSDESRIAAENTASLIAAAPELLEALEDVAATRSFFLRGMPSTIQIKEIIETLNRVESAIKKAKGL